MVLGFGNKGFLKKPTQYAAERTGAGPPTTVGHAERLLPSFDYIIVGGGTAGSVLASRLTEDKKISVLVLESGGDNRNVLEARTPLAYGKLFHGPQDWNYYTTPQEQLANRELFWPRGKMLGGSSSINAMISHQADRADFDEWANVFGCQGWSYNDILPYMRKSEHFTPNPNRPPINLIHRGDAGPWKTGYSYLTDISENGFLASCQQAGLEMSADINTPDGSLGATRLQTFIDSRGARSSAATAYLTQEVRNRPNLHIAIDVHVASVFFDRGTPTDTPKALGVSLQTKQGGPIYDVHAKKEVILCGGTVNTPQLLMLSGIGPREELQKHGLPVVKVNENVGKHMKDHLTASGILLKTKDGQSLDYLYDDIKAIPSLVRWLITGGGPLSTNGAEIAAFLRSTNLPPEIQLPKGSAQPLDYTSGNVGPDIELIGFPVGVIHHGDERLPNGEGAFTLMSIGLRPQSEGTVTLKSRDPYEHPIIDPRYFTDPEDNDRTVMMAGLRVCLKIMRMPAFAKFLAPVEINDDPESKWWPYSSSNIDAITDDQLRRWMTRTAFTLYHPVSSARMGPDANTSVVDLHCRVHGVNNLRVVDASIFPEQISGHPTAPVISIAEKMADVIRGVSSINADATRVAPIDSRVPQARL